MDEGQLMKTIVVSSDWEEVLQHIIEEENINPRDIDIILLVDAFMKYLINLQKFDFHIPARFILIAAILLRLKCESLEIKQPRLREEKIPEIQTDVPLLDMPIMRVPKRRVTLTDLIGAMSKAIEFEERKKERKIRIRHAVENLIPVDYEDIEVRIKNVFDEICEKHIGKFTELTGKWDRKEIVYKFIPLLHLSNNGKIHCEQNELFGEIFISLREQCDETTDSENNKQEEIEVAPEKAAKDL